MSRQTALSPMLCATKRVVVACGALRSRRGKHPSHRNVWASDRARTIILMMFTGACLCSSWGCASLRQRLSHRSAECSQLCEESRSARDAGRAEEAEQYLDAAIRRRPTDADTKLQLAEELWSSGRQLAAAEEVANVLETSPNDIQAALRLAQMQLEIGRTEAAYQAAQTAYRIDPACPEALRLKAVLEERRGDTDAALTTALRLVDAVPDDVEAKLQLAMLYRRRGQANRAAPLLRSAGSHALATAEQRQEAAWQLGLAYADCQRWSDAQAVMNPIVHERLHMTAEDWYQYARIEWQCSHHEQAMLAVNQALSQQPKHPQAVELARNLEAGRTASAVVPAGFRSGTQHAAR
jgi:lipopolysaccharide biosynthesis regulator YciM